MLLDSHVAIVFGSIIIPFRYQSHGFGVPNDKGRLTLADKIILSTCYSMPLVVIVSDKVTAFSMFLRAIEP